MVLSLCPTIYVDLGEHINTYVTGEACFVDPMK